MIPVGLLAVSHHVPERIVTNKELEGRLDTTDEWISSRTGIRERRIANDDETSSSLGIQAATKLLAKSGCSPEDLDLVIVATMTPDTLLPATACRVQAAIGAVNAGAFDVSIACSGFAYALSLGASYVSSKIAKKVLVVGADVMSRVLDLEDRNTSVLFGDGAGAALLGEVQPGYGLLAQELGSDGSGGHHLTIPAGAGARPPKQGALSGQDFTLQMNGREVFRFAVKVMGDAAVAVIAKAGLKPEDISLFIPHQANKRIIEAASKRLGLCESKVFVNLQKYGNTSCASIPIALSEAVESGRIQEGDRVLSVGFGGGLAWGAQVWRWGGLLNGKS